MKAVLIFFALRLISVNADCPPNSIWVADPLQCNFTCTPQGINFECNLNFSGGCECFSGRHFNNQNGQCEKVECENLNCVDKPNMRFYEKCVSGSTQSCLDSGDAVTDDCQWGCLCKEGFCRGNDGTCVKRN